MKYASQTVGQRREKSGPHIAGEGVLMHPRKSKVIAEGTLRKDSA